MKTFEVTNIKYDTDGADVSLPEKIIIVVPDDVVGYDETSEYISDEISNITGFCHAGFDTVPEIPQP